MKKLYIVPIEDLEDNNRGYLVIAADSEDQCNLLAGKEVLTKRWNCHCTAGKPYMLPGHYDGQSTVLAAINTDSGNAMMMDSFKII